MRRTPPHEAHQVVRLVNLARHTRACRVRLRASGQRREVKQEQVTAAAGPVTMRQTLALELLMRRRAALNDLANAASETSSPNEPGPTV